VVSTAGGYCISNLLLKSFWIVPFRFSSLMAYHHLTLLIAGGYHSLLQQIKTRIEHVNRNNTMARLRTARRGRQEQDGVATKTPGPTDAYGCVNFAPKIPQADIEVLEEAHQKLLEYFEKEGPSASRATIDNLMTETFAMQRQTVNATPSPSVDEIKEQWPYLFQQRYLCMHFKLLTNIPIHTIISQSFQSKGTRIKNFFAKSTKPVIREILDEMSGELASVALGTVMLVQAHFKEEKDSLFVLADVSLF